MSATAKVITLKGNKNRPESAEHIIAFPGGSISVCRTTDNKYWAHIEVRDGSAWGDGTGIVLEGRIDRNNRDVEDIPEHEIVFHIAILVGVAQ